ncbi:hypothetical protein FDI24_gp145 [Acidovorax phage ACP17]|uniref:Uncharacterized protein n=1 Tax=Acidovorax phage ACP17 TaxID=2010329 RepID=A0A218M309_9CAUD|nr:hypothetical protein FDI24_gp145 [Acidovorax phage ACP17]ASD50426.1 hypothetical protein [Acidovorax phage ACP17]
MILHEDQLYDAQTRQSVLAATLGNLAQVGSMLNQTNGSSYRELKAIYDDVLAVAKFHAADARKAQEA